VVASTLDKQEPSISTKQEVNADSYVTFHNGQMFRDGLSFSGYERNKVWINEGGKFADLSDLSGADSPNDSRAVVAADFDDDGDVDLFVHSIQRERHLLLRNDAIAPGAAGTGYLKLRLQASVGQYEAVGATVTVKGPAGPTSQVLSRGAGFVSCQPPELVFGLGGAPSAEVLVTWPGQREPESFGSLPAGTRAKLVQGVGKPVPIVTPGVALPDPLPPGLRLSEGDQLAALAVRDADGTTRVIDLTSKDGKPTFLNFWASYCAPCVKEIPVLQALADRGEVHVVAVSLDVPERVGTATELMTARGGRFPSWFLGAEEDPANGARRVEDVVDLERLPIPTTLVLSAEGRVESILRGPLDVPDER